MRKRKTKKRRKARAQKTRNNNHQWTNAQRNTDKEATKRHRKRQNFFSKTWRNIKTTGFTTRCELTLMEMGVNDSWPKPSILDGNKWSNIRFLTLNRENEKRKAKKQKAKSGGTKKRKNVKRKSEGGHGCSRKASNNHQWTNAQRNTDKEMTKRWRKRQKLFL